MASRRSLLRSLMRRAEGGLDLPSMFLTTGLAALAAFLISTYILLFTILRLIFYARPPDPSAAGFRNWFKRFIYRVTRALLVLNCVLIAAVVMDCVFKLLDYKREKSLVGLTAGIGPGVGSE